MSSAYSCTTAATAGSSGISPVISTCSHRTMGRGTRSHHSAAPPLLMLPLMLPVMLAMLPAMLLLMLAMRPLMLAMLPLKRPPGRLLPGPSSSLQLSVSLPLALLRCCGRCTGGTLVRMTQNSRKSVPAACRAGGNQRPLRLLCATAGSC